MKMPPWLQLNRYKSNAAKSDDIKDVRRRTDQKLRAQAAQRRLDSENNEVPNPPMGA
jgi:hypothetical protein